MFSLQSACQSVVPWTNRAKTNPHAIDLASDRMYQAVVLLALHRFYDLDFARVEVVAELEDTQEESLVRFSLRGESGVWSEFCHEGLGISGDVAVWAKPGHDIADCVRRHPQCGTRDAWTAALGLPDGYPCGIESTVSADGRSLTVTVTPC